MQHEKIRKFMTTHLIITWFAVIGISIVGIMLRCIVKFNNYTNHYQFISFNTPEDFFESDDDDNDDETEE